jgi:hypothetical protein
MICGVRDGDSCVWAMSMRSCGPTTVHPDDAAATGFVFMMIMASVTTLVGSATRLGCCSPLLMVNSHNFIIERNADMFIFLFI